MPRPRFVKNAFWTAVALVCAALACLLWRLLHPEASYQGKSAHEWLQMASLNYAGDETKDDFFEAFRVMGNKADPVLVEAIEAREKPLAGFYAALYARLPEAIGKGLPAPTQREDLLALRAAALFVLRRTPSNNLTPKLLPLLARNDPDARLAVLSIARLDVSHIPLLLKVSADHDARVRSAALQHLAEFGPGAANAVSVVTKLCGDSCIDVRHDAAWALWKITGQTNTTLPALESILRPDLDAERLKATAYHLLVMGDKNPILVTTLVNSLTNYDAGDRSVVYSLLGEIGPPAAAAIPVLRKALKDPQPEIRRRAEVALSAIAPEDR